MNQETARDICRTIAAHYGPMAQVVKTIEELGELIQVLAKMHYSINDGYGATPELQENFIEELADVGIMLFQMGMIFNLEDDLIKKTEEKLLRQLERIKNETP